MTTAQFNHFEPLVWRRTEQTPILVTPSLVTTYCYHCQADVQPEVIVSPFLSAPLSRCPRCSSVIQKRAVDAGAEVGRYGEAG